MKGLRFKHICMATLTALGINVPQLSLAETSTASTSSNGTQYTTANQLLNLSNLSSTDQSTVNTTINTVSSFMTSSEIAALGNALGPVPTSCDASAPSATCADVIDNQKNVVAALAIINQMQGQLSASQMNTLVTWVSGQASTNGAVADVMTNFQTMLNTLSKNTPSGSDVATTAITVFTNNQTSASLGTILTNAPTLLSEVYKINTTYSSQLSSTQQQQLVTWATQNQTSPNFKTVLDNLSTTLNTIKNLPSAISANASSVQTSLFTLMSNNINSSNLASDIENYNAFIQQTNMAVTTPSATSLTFTVNNSKISSTVNLLPTDSIQLTWPVSSNFPPMPQPGSANYQAELVKWVQDLSLVKTYQNLIANNTTRFYSFLSSAYANHYGYVGSTKTERAKPLQQRLQDWINGLSNTDRNKIITAFINTTGFAAPQLTQTANLIPNSSNQNMGTLVNQQAYTSLYKQKQNMMTNFQNEFIGMIYFQQNPNLSFTVTNPSGQTVQATWSGFVNILLQQAAANPSAASNLQAILPSHTNWANTKTPPTVPVSTVFYNMQTKLAQYNLQDNSSNLESSLANYIIANKGSSNIGDIVQDYNDAIATIATTQPPKGYTGSDWSSIQTSELAWLTQNPSKASNVKNFTGDDFENALIAINNLPSSISTTKADLQNALFSIMENSSTASDISTTLKAFTQSIVSISNVVTPITGLPSSFNFTVQNSSLLPKSMPSMQLSWPQATLPAMPQPGSANYLSNLQTWVTQYSQLKSQQNLIAQNSTRFYTALVSNFVSTYAFEKAPKANQNESLQQRMQNWINTLTPSQREKIYQSFLGASPGHAFYLITQGQYNGTPTYNYTDKSGSGEFGRNNSGIVAVASDTYTSIQGQAKQVLANYTQAYNALVYLQQNPNLDFTITDASGTTKNATFPGFINALTQLISNNPENAQYLQGLLPNSTDLQNGKAATAASLLNTLYDIKTQLPSDLQNLAGPLEQSIINYIGTNAGSANLPQAMQNIFSGFQTMLTTFTQYNTQYSKLPPAVATSYKTAITNLLNEVTKNPQNTTYIASASTQILTALVNINSNVATAYPSDAQQLETTMMNMVEDNLNNPNVGNLVQAFGTALGSDNFGKLYSTEVKLEPNSTASLNVGILSNATTQTIWQQKVIPKILAAIEAQPADAQQIIDNANALPTALNLTIKTMSALQQAGVLSAQDIYNTQYALTTYALNNNTSSIATALQGYEKALPQLISILVKYKTNPPKGVTASDWNADVAEFFKLMANNPEDATNIRKAVNNLPGVYSAIYTINTKLLDDKGNPKYSSEMTTLATNILQTLEKNPGDTSLATSFTQLSNQLKAFYQRASTPLDSKKQPITETWDQVLTNTLTAMANNFSNAGHIMAATKALPNLFAAINSSGLSTKQQTTLETAMFTYLKTNQGNDLALGKNVENYTTAIQTLFTPTNLKKYNADGITTDELIDWVSKNPGNAAVIQSSLTQLTDLHQDIENMPYLSYAQKTAIVNAIPNLFTNNISSDSLKTLVSGFKSGITKITSALNSDVAKKIQGLDNGVYWQDIVSSIATAVATAPQNVANIASAAQQMLTTMNQLNSTANKNSSGVWLPASLSSALTDLLKNNASNPNLANVYQDFNSNIQKLNTLVDNNPLVSTTDIESLWQQLASNQVNKSATRFFNNFTQTLNTINTLASSAQKSTLIQDYFSFVKVNANNPNFTGFAQQYNSFLTLLSNNPKNTTLWTSFASLQNAMTSNNGDDNTTAIMSSFANLFTAQVNNPDLSSITTALLDNYKNLTATEIKNVSTILTNDPTISADDLVKTAKNLSVSNLVSLITPLVPQSAGKAAYDAANQKDLDELQNDILPYIMPSANSQQLLSYLQKNPNDIQKMFRALIIGTVVKNVYPNTLSTNSLTTSSMITMDHVISMLQLNSNNLTIGDLASYTNLLKNPAAGLPASFADELSSFTKYSIYAADPQGAGAACSSSSSSCNINDATTANDTLKPPFTMTQIQSAGLNQMMYSQPQALINMLTAIKGVPSSLDSTIASIINNNLINGSQVSTFMQALTVYGKIQQNSTYIRSLSQGKTKAESQGIQEQIGNLMSFLSVAGAKADMFNNNTTLSAEIASQGEQTVWKNIVNQNPFKVVEVQDQGGTNYNKDSSVKYFDAYYFGGIALNSAPDLTSSEQSALGTALQTFTQTEMTPMYTCNSNPTGWGCDLTKDFDAIGDFVKGLFSGSSVPDILRDVGLGIASVIAAPAVAGIALDNAGTVGLLGEFQFGQHVDIDWFLNDLRKDGFVPQETYNDIQTAFSAVTAGNSAETLLQKGEAFGNNCTNGEIFKCADEMSQADMVGYANSITAAYTSSGMNILQRFASGVGSIASIAGMLAGAIGGAAALSMSADMIGQLSTDLSVSIQNLPEIKDLPDSMFDVKGNANTIEINGKKVTVKTLQNQLENLQSRLEYLSKEYPQEDSFLDAYNNVTDYINDFSKRFENEPATSNAPKARPDKKLDLVDKSVKSKVAKIKKLNSRYTKLQERFEKLSNSHKNSELQKKITTDLENIRVEHNKLVDSLEKDKDRLNKLNRDYGTFNTSESNLISDLLEEISNNDTKYSLQSNDTVETFTSEANTIEKNLTSLKTLEEKINTLENKLDKSKGNQLSNVKRQIAKAIKDRGDLLDDIDTRLRKLSSLPNADPEEILRLQQNFSIDLDEMANNLKLKSRGIHNMLREEKNKLSQLQNQLDRMPDRLVASRYRMKLRIENVENKINNLELQKSNLQQMESSSGFAKSATSPQIDLYESLNNKILAYIKENKLNADDFLTEDKSGTHWNQDIISRALDENEATEFTNLSSIINKPSFNYPDTKTVGDVQRANRLYKDLKIKKSMGKNKVKFLEEVEFNDGKKGLLQDIDTKSPYNSNTLNATEDLVNKRFKLIRRIKRTIEGIHETQDDLVDLKYNASEDELVWIKAINEAKKNGVTNFKTPEFEELENNAVNSQKNLTEWYKQQLDTLKAGKRTPAINNMIDDLQITYDQDNAHLQWLENSRYERAEILNANTDLSVAKGDLKQIQDEFKAFKLKNDISRATGYGKLEGKSFDEFIKLTDELNEKSEKLAKAQAKKNSLKQNYEGKIHDKKKSLSKNEQKYTTTENHITNLTKQLDELNKSENPNPEEVENLNIAINNAKSLLEQTKTIITKQELSLKDLIKKQKLLEEDQKVTITIETDTSKLKQLQSQQDELNTNPSPLTSTQQSSLDSINQKISDLQKQIDTKTKQQTKLNKHIKNLDKKSNKTIGLAKAGATTIDNIARHHDQEDNTHKHLHGPKYMPQNAQTHLKPEQSANAVTNHRNTDNINNLQINPKTPLHGAKTEPSAEMHKHKQAHQHKDTTASSVPTTQASTNTSANSYFPTGQPALPKGGSSVTINGKPIKNEVENVHLPKTPVFAPEKQTNDGRPPVPQGKSETTTKVHKSMFFGYTRTTVPADEGNKTEGTKSLPNGAHPSTRAKDPFGFFG